MENFNEFGFHVVPEAQTEPEYDHSNENRHADGSVCNCPFWYCLERMEQEASDA